MSTFGKFETTVVPSEIGETFTVDTPVAFTVHDHLETGIVTKQLKNSAVIEINETADNKQLMSKSNGVIIVNYKQMKKI
ncbi:hypothetical protein [Enterococcus saccharolyticus]|uniref:Uncharacterized protein n=1 Tax=Enterococcus saccharolyticus subsp. saccharolyticus ATCC 43076 TaxID=1139996 RepID=S0NQB1_9ENTE|nr:hypothetical protein [Enterococcus saccharolyticus]EOT30489.1 hypothetical protein OMQ_00192 [Enterococcus saccharolyticus subsp. saccharolyticus ATCC 43076]EOT80050.1 hypothetical protein I572_00574 [Enterococcus saccharolyticus subsp. saccharolyticus ATCC 43076]OJG86484.1 hypothetical protein RV16_GL000967 [Enterococcus saccharolyticus]